MGLSSFPQLGGMCSVGVVGVPVTEGCCVVLRGVVKPRE